MAALPIIAKQKLSEDDPPVVADVPVTVVAGATEDVTFRLNVEEPAWVDDPDLVIAVDVEKSDDGLNWKYFFGATFRGGARGRNGLLPSVGMGRIGTKFSRSFSLRPALKVSKHSASSFGGKISKSVGLDVEVK